MGFHNLGIYEIYLEDWGMVSSDEFRLCMNGCLGYSPKQITEIGTYNSLLINCPFYDAKKETFESSHKQFTSCFPGGFAWELLELHSGPPKVAFTWRHWAKFEGPYNGTAPTNENLEMIGSAVATVTDSQKLSKFEVFFDPNPMFFKLTGGKLAGKK